MLVDDPDGDETAPLVKRLAFRGRIQRNASWTRGRQQRIHEPGAIATALRGLRDDDHASGSMGFAIRPPCRGPDHRPSAFQNKAFAQLQRDIPILEPIGPGHLLRELQGALQVRSGEWNQHRGSIVAISGLVSCGLHHWSTFLLLAVLVAST
jgi:hypothetical protein